MREILSVFQDVEDPRRGNAKRHDLQETLTIALVSMLAGGRTCVDMEDYGRVWEPWLREFMTLPNGIPSHDTFSRLFRMLDPAGLQTALLRLTQDWADRLGEVVAVDGKALRRSFEDAAERSPTHLLQAFASEAKLTLAQVEVDGKSNEIPALPALLELIDVRGRTVTADAMHAQRGTAAAIVAKGGDYALALKRNQGTLHEDVTTYLDSPPASAELLSHQQVDKGHGRVEKRTATVCHDVDWLLERHDWPGLSAIGKVTAERRLASGAESVDTRYHLLSAKPEAERFGRTVRAHWAIENADAAHRTPALGAGRVDGRGPGAQPQGQQRRLPGGRPAARPEHRADAPRQALHPPQVHPRAAETGVPRRNDPLRPQAGVGAHLKCDCPAQPA